MKKRLSVMLFLAFALTPVLAPPAHAGIVCGIAGTVADKYLTDIHGYYGPIEESLHEVCNATP